MADDSVDAVAAAADALAAAVDGDFNDGANGVTSATDVSENGSALKKRALELLTEAADEAEAAANADDLELEATTLDDVMVSPVLKKARVEEAKIEEDDDALTGVNLEGVDDEDDVDLGDIADDDADALAPPDASTDEDEEPRRQHGNGHGKQLDVVTLDEDEDDDEDEEEEDDDGGEDELDDEDDEEDGQLLSPMQRRKIDQNKTEARQLLHQLDGSARSKLVLTALEKYGEDLFDGHEAARDGILVDACANDAMLGLLKEAIRVSALPLQGTEDAPLEVDDDEDYGDEDEDDEDDGEETDDASGKRGPRHFEDDDEDDDEDTPAEINLLSDEETDDNASTHVIGGMNKDDDEDNEEDDEDEDDDTAGTGGELTVESATGDEDSLDELSS